MPIMHVKSNTVANGTNTDLIRPSDWNSEHAYTLVDGVSISGNNTAGVLANISSGTLYLAGGNNITLSQNANSITISNGDAFRSSYENAPGVPLTAITLNGASVSLCAAFLLPEQGSYSFLRIPSLMTTNSTTLATTAASLNGSCAIYSTWNAVVYSMGTGASSRSLTSVASGSGGFTFMNSVSIAANGTQGSFSQFFTGQAEGVTTSFSTQYSVSQTNMPYSTTFFTQITGGRFIDIPFANSLSAGPYWLVLGMSTSSAANSTGVSAATNCNVRYSNNYGVSMFTNVIGVMGSTNRTSGGLMGAASFSTAGGGTTAALPISAFSSHVTRPYFQLLRSN